MFAALAATPSAAVAAAPSTPRKPAPSSSLASLASPTRGLSTPGPATAHTTKGTTLFPLAAVPAVSARTNLLLTSGSDNGAAAAAVLGVATPAADNTVFSVSNLAGTKRKTASSQQQEEEHKQPQQSRRQRVQPPAAAAAAIEVDSSED